MQTHCYTEPTQTFQYTNFYSRHLPGVKKALGQEVGGGRYFLIWSIRGIRGCDAGQGLVLVLSVLNRVYNFARVFPKQCAGFVRVCSNYKQGVSCTIDFVLVGSCPKQCTTIEGVVLNRVCILGIFCPKQGQRLTYTQILVEYSPSPPRGRKVSFKGEALRLLRTNSSQTNFEQNIKNFENRLIERRYPVAIIVRKHRSEVKFANRKTPFNTETNPHVGNLFLHNTTRL